MILNKMRANAALAVCVGLGLRLLFVLKFPAFDTGDGPFYIRLAANWLKNGVYGFAIDGRLTPVDMRVPGYPAFLAAIFAFAGNSPRAVMLVQVAVDLATCFLIVGIAALLARPESRRRVAFVALWLAALCPFIANYTAVVLCEVLVTFLTALALLVLMETEIGRPGGVKSRNYGTSMAWFLAGIVAGLGTLVRPETPLVLAAAGLTATAKWWRPRDWIKIVRVGLLMATGLVLPLLPWTARNLRTLHEIQFLAPRYSQLPGEVIPRGFTAWTNTWMWRMRDVYLVTWNLNDAPISAGAIPSSAFDSPEERDRIQALLDSYNDTLTETDEMDAQFGQIARERTSRQPLRTYLKVPALRCFALWFTPRTELLPLAGHLTPIYKEWDEDRPDFLMTLALAALNVGFVALAIVGLFKAWGRPAVAFLLLFVILRTIFIASFADSPEPRYVLECFPIVLAFGALAFEQRVRPRADQLSSTGSG
ncbi:MAG TPA: glycosyltransferase family 39 protein [Candidatus Acidoferrales bacterium]|nr:glycosyltransferase family 39 protein [Candidatus Acidoferrales bacterium]